MAKTDLAVEFLTGVTMVMTNTDPQRAKDLWLPVKDRTDSTSLIDYYYYIFFTNHFFQTRFHLHSILYIFYIYY